MVSHELRFFASFLGGLALFCHFGLDRLVRGAITSRAHLDGAAPAARAPRVPSAANHRRDYGRFV